MPDRIDPDCRDGKHPACPGWTWDTDTDAEARCACACHLNTIHDPREGLTNE